MVYSLQILRELIEEKIEEAEIEVKESHELSQNSYGAGYDRGFIEALKGILAKIPDEKKNE